VGREPLRVPVLFFLQQFIDARDGVVAALRLRDFGGARESCATIRVARSSESSGC
jgi:hypothetical protein